jgi:hypothetical protein
MREIHRNWIGAVILLGSLGLLLCCASAVFASSQHSVACDNIGYYRINYGHCDDISDSYPPYFWFFHENYYGYVNDNMDYPRYHPVGWYTTSQFYQTRYYLSGNGGSRIDNYHVGSSTMRQRFGGGGRSGGGANGLFGGGGRGSNKHFSGGHRP